MNASLKLLAADVFAIGLLATFAGCANTPLRQSSADNMNLIPASQVASNIQPPVPIRTVAPRYPDSMKRSGIPGTVSVNCLIDENGKVKEAEVVDSSDRAFADPAVEALWKWVFQPGQRDGVKVPMRVNVPVRFSITDA